MKLKISEWKFFKISDLFSKVNVKKITKIPNEVGEIPLVTSQSTNNGIATWVSKNKFKEYIIDKKCISISTNGSCFECFYQSQPFIINSDVEVIYSEKLENENIAFFLITILLKQQEKYSYGMKNKGNKIWDTKIPLPITIDGNPDWKYMENFIKSIKERERELWTFWIIKSEKNIFWFFKM